MSVPTSLRAAHSVGARNRLITLAGAIVVTVAVAGYVWHVLPNVPSAIRWSVHGSVAPIIGVFLFRQPIPNMRLSWADAPLIALAIGYMLAVTLVAGHFGFRRTYSEPIAALALASLAAMTLCATLRIRALPPAAAGTSGWWQVALAVAVAVAASLANAWDSGPSVPAELLWDFVLVGMTEEFAFRGVIQGWLHTAWSGRWLGLSSANWVTALLFAWMHNPLFASNHLPWFLYLVPMGLVFGAWRDRTGSWLLPGLAHGLIAPLLYAWSLTGLVHLPGS